MEKHMQRHLCGICCRLHNHATHNLSILVRIVCVWLLFPSSDKESQVYFTSRCMRYCFIKKCLCLMCLYSRIIHCTWVHPPKYYPPFFGYYFLNFMLVILLMLHMFWAYLILRMVNMFLFGSVSCSTFIFGNMFFSNCLVWMVLQWVSK